MTARKMDRQEFSAWLLLQGFEGDDMGYRKRKVGPYVISVANQGEYGPIAVKVQDAESIALRKTWEAVFRKSYRTYKGAYRRILHFIELGEAGGSENFEGTVTSQGLRVGREDRQQ